MALWAYSTVVCWYAQWSVRRAKLPVRFAPSYASKTTPSFADMLATLRRECWIIWISDQADRGRLDQKSLAPLLDVAATAENAGHCVPRLPKSGLAWLTKWTTFVALHQHSFSRTEEPRDSAWTCT
jgi:hypothetical protein